MKTTYIFNPSDKNLTFQTRMMSSLIFKPNYLWKRTTFGTVQNFRQYVSIRKIALSKASAVNHGSDQPVHPCSLFSSYTEYLNAHQNLVWCVLSNVWSIRLVAVRLPPHWLSQCTESYTLHWGSSVI